jgi:hypothetical protein
MTLERCSDSNSDNDSDGEIYSRQTVVPVTAA